MSDLQTFFENHTGRLIHKWSHYLPIYEKYFQKYRGTDVCLVEIGVYNGGSLQMWKYFFGPAARIHGVDQNPLCKQFEDDQVHVHIGDQEDRAFLQALAREIPRIDILIDDGGHGMRQQIVTFEELYPRVEPTGLYLCEDTHTSYWREYGGGCRRRGTFIEYAKGLVDSLHAWHSRDAKSLAVSDFTRSTQAIHFHDSLLVIEKSPRERPRDCKVGTAILPAPIYHEPLRDKIVRRLKRMLGS